jgi:PAS domain S-box-containing protein
VLLIEDNPADSRLIREYLAEERDAHFDVAVASRLGAGLDHLTHHGADAVLLDLSLPDSQGLDTFSTLRAHHPGVPVVVLTGLADDAVALQAVQRGAQDFLVKGDVNSVLLARAVRYAVERRRAEETVRRRNQELTLLNRVIAVSIAVGEPEQLLQVACEEMAAVFRLPRVTARLVDDERTAVRVVAEYAVEGLPSSLGWEEQLAGNACLQQLLEERSPLTVYADEAGGNGPADAASSPHPMLGLMRRLNLQALLRVPLVADNVAVGCLSLCSQAPHRFTTEETQLAQRVADQVGSALTRVRLERNQRRLITAVEQIGEAIILASLDGSIQYVNPAFEQLTGYGAAEARGRSLDLLAGRDTNAETMAEVQSALARGDTWRGRLTSRSRDDTTSVADVTAGPVRDDRGSIVSYVIVARDITQELQLEERYRQAQKMEAVGRLTGGIAHDFNNLLTAINGFAELAQLDLTPDHPAWEKVTRVLNSGQRAVKLVSQLLAFSRKQIIRPQVLDLNARVAEMGSMLRHIIGEDILLVTVLAPDLWPIKADPAQLEQVIVNLVVNARDAMPSGGKLTIETANVALDTAYAANHLEVLPGEYALLAISDTGIGMSPEVMSHLFEPYFTTKGVGKGSGLGLATVFGIVKQNGGHISCYSEEGVGTTFKIYLPRVHAATPGCEATAEAVGPGGRETVLVVEDSPEVRAMICQALQLHGYRVLEARDADSGVRLVADFPEVIHLLVTDVVMPGAGGRQLAHALTAARPDLKVLFISGYTENAIAHHGVLDANVAFLQKPFTMAVLARKVRSVLDS